MALARTLAPLLAATALLLVTAPAAPAARHQPKAPVADPPSAHATAEEPPEHQLTEVPSAATQTSLAAELGSSGQVDPLSGLGIRNPVCDQPAQIRAAATRTACEAAGAPESTYPASNYGFDVFIPTGVTHPIGDFTAAFVTILNGIWLGLLFVLKLTLALLGLAFGLNPFANGPTMARISATVARVYAQITEPWLPALVVCAGIAMAYRGLLRRDVAGSLAATLAGLALLLLGLWVIHSPRQTVGQLASFSDEVALSAIAAPQSGSLARPAGSYAEAMSRLWARLVEVPFAGLDFSDVGWALGPPPAEAVKRADEKFCEDNGALALLNQLAKLGIEDAKHRCAQFAQRRYGRPRSVVDLYLRSSPGSAARAALWDYFDNDPRYKPKVAAQGGDGALTRLSMLALFALGLLGAILLLAWLAIRLFTQAAIAFVLLLAAPFALFLPLAGEAGRRGFRRWGLGLAGAVLAKVVYAAFLSIVLLGITIIGQVEGPAGSATGFLLAAAFSWAVFLKRAELIGWLSVGEHERLAQLGGIGGLAALGLSQRRTRPHTQPRAGRSAAGLARRTRERAQLGREATRATARQGLAASARALAEQRSPAAARPPRSASRAAPSPDASPVPRSQGNRGPPRRPTARAGGTRSRLRRAPATTAEPPSPETPPSAARPAKPSASAAASSPALPARTASCCAAPPTPPTTPTAPASSAAASKRCAAPSARPPRSGSRRRESAICSASPCSSPTPRAPRPPPAPRSSACARPEEGSSKTAAHTSAACAASAATPPAWPRAETSAAGPSRWPSAGGPCCSFLSAPRSLPSPCFSTPPRRRLRRRPSCGSALIGPRRAASPPPPCAAAPAASSPPSCATRSAIAARRRPPAPCGQPPPRPSPRACAAARPAPAPPRPAPPRASAR